MDYGLYGILVKNVDYCDAFIRLLFWRHPFTAVMFSLISHLEWIRFL